MTSVGHQAVVLRVLHIVLSCWVLLPSVVPAATAVLQRLHKHAQACFGHQQLLRVSVVIIRKAKELSIGMRWLDRAWQELSNWPVRSERTSGTQTDELKSSKAKGACLRTQDPKYLAHVTGTTYHHPFIHSSIHSFTHSLIHSFIRVLGRLSRPSYIHSDDNE